MALNPMQRKSRNSFLLGAVLTLLLTSIVIAILFLQVAKLKQEATDLENSYVFAYVLKTNVESGIEITLSDLVETKISLNMLPEDALLSEKSIKDINNKFKDKKLSDELAAMVQNLKSIAELPDLAVAKINLTAGTVLTESLVAERDEKTEKDTRLQEYNMIVLPTQLEVDDYIDIRWMLPNGQDYVVVSKKRVIDCDADTVWIKMDEGELLVMSSAIVEAYTVTGSKLYAVKYVEPGIQENAVTTYTPSNAVTELILADSNITQEASKKLEQRYAEALKASRQKNIQSVLDNYSEDAKDNIEEKIEEEIVKQQEARQMYLDELDASVE